MLAGTCLQTGHFPRRAVQREQLTAWGQGRAGGAGDKEPQTLPGLALVELRQRLGPPLEQFDPGARDAEAGLVEEKGLVGSPPPGVALAAVEADGQVGPFLLLPNSLEGEEALPRQSLNQRLFARQSRPLGVGGREGRAPVLLAGVPGQERAGEDVACTIGPNNPHADGVRGHVCKFRPPGSV